MMRPAAFQNVNEAWRHLVTELMHYGTPRSPRGMATREIQHASLSFNMSRPVLACRDRKLSYRFMAAEPLWYLAGSDSLHAIAQYNPRMGEFSDDGETLYGAYGPPIMAQLDHVTNALLKDRHTRQAWLTIWKPNPKPSKDIPCTIGLGWNIVGNLLNCHVYMRSSDAFLGAPYDWFSFTILTCMIACAYNAAKCGPGMAPGLAINLGHLHWTAASSHVYDRDIEAIRACLRSKRWVPSPRIPLSAIAKGDHDAILEGLRRRRDKKPPGPGQFDPRPQWGGI